MMSLAVQIGLFTIIVCSTVEAANNYHNLRGNKRPRYVNDYEPEPPISSHVYWDSNSVYNSPDKFEQNVDPRGSDDDWQHTIDNPHVVINHGRHRYRTSPEPGYYYPAERHLGEMDYLQTRHGRPTFEHGYPLDDRRYLHPQHQHTDFEVHPIYAESEPHHRFVDTSSPQYLQKIDRHSNSKWTPYDDAILERHYQKVDEKYQQRSGRHIRELPFDQNIEKDSNVLDTLESPVTVEGSTVSNKEDQVMSHDKSTNNKSVDDKDGHMRVLRRVVLSINDDETDVEVED